MVCAYLRADCVQTLEELPERELLQVTVLQWHLVPQPLFTHREPAQELWAAHDGLACSTRHMIRLQ